MVKTRIRVGMVEALSTDFYQMYLVKFMHLGEQCGYHHTENSALLFSWRKRSCT